MSDPYKVLGVSPDASDDEIKQAYRRLAKKYHPDINPGDEEAARKMQEINAAYEQIKNPEKQASSSGPSGYNPYGYNPYGYSSGGSSGQTAQGDSYQEAAYHYLRMGRYREALTALENSSNRDARWYYISAMANDRLGNQVTALEHIRKAVSMDPGNAVYLNALERIRSGGTAYRTQAGNYGGFELRQGNCSNLCWCWFMSLFCCPGRCC